MVDVGMVRVATDVCFLLLSSLSSSRPAVVVTIAVRVATDLVLAITVLGAALTLVTVNIAPLISK